MGNALTFDVTEPWRKGLVRLKDFLPLLPPRKDLQGYFILFHTGSDSLFGSEAYYTQESALSEEVASFLVERGIKGVGIDTASVDTYPFPVHRLLLGNEILICEGLTNLKKLLKKEAFLTVLPLKLQGCSGSPLRVFAFIEAF